MTPTTPRRAPRQIAVGVAVLMALLVLPACGDDGDDAGTVSATETTSDEASTVAVTLQEFAVAADPATAPAGSVTFNVTNEGPDDVHEFVVIKTDLAVTDLPS